MCRSPLSNGLEGDVIYLDSLYYKHRRFVPYSAYGEEDSRLPRGELLGNILRGGDRGGSSHYGGGRRGRRGGEVEAGDGRAITP